jgi:hypothetical protein
MTVAHVYTVAFQGTEARPSIGQASVREPLPVRPFQNLSGLR